MTSDELKARRKRLNLTQDAAAKELGLQPRQYQNLEMGVSNISLTIELLVKALDRDRKSRDPHAS